MASKELTVKLGLNISQFEQQLKRANNLIDRTTAHAFQMEQALVGATRAHGEGDKAAQRLKRHAYEQWIQETLIEKERQQSLRTISAIDRASQRLKRTQYEQWWVNALNNQELEKSNTKINQIKGKMSEWTSKASALTSLSRSTDRVLGSIWNKLKGIVGTYIGLMGTKAVIGVTDTLVGAQNKLNYTNAGILGTEGYNADGTYSTATLDATQESLDKIYTSSQKVRTSYMDMVSNVSKTMALSGKAFGGNIDNAIRFQEIMAEAYSVGGATAKEMESSMYQLTQALGAGILAGDELRSVREGAPLAYQAIEKYAQGIHNTTDSLKDMASQGKITSDIVIAGIMDAGSTLDSAFAQTRQTFGQTLNQIKSAATYAFQPVMEKLTDTLQMAIDNGMIQRFEAFFTNLAKMVMIVVTTVEKGIYWIAENWSWLKNVIVGALIAIATYLIMVKTISAVVWVTQHMDILKIIIDLWRVFAVIGVIIAMVLALAYVFILWKTGAIDTCSAIYSALLIIGGALILLGILTLGWVAIVIGAALIIVAAIFKAFNQICGFINGLGAYISAVCDNIGIYWNNMCNDMKSFFWNAIADMLEKCQWLIDGINKIRKALGKEEITVDAIRSLAEGYANDKQEYVDPNDAYYRAFHEGFTWGDGVKNSINSWGSKFQSGGVNGSVMDNLANKLGLDFTGMGSFPTTGTEHDDVEKLLGNIDDNTGSIAESMGLTNEDLAYLRRVADMEWKKEFTTANINIKMDNNIQSEADYDGFVTRLRDDMYDEMIRLADGAYVY